MSQHTHDAPLPEEESREQGYSDTPATLELHISVRDQEVIHELLQYEDATREEFARAALRVGVLSIRQASGLLDAESLKHEGERVVNNVRTELEKHAEQTRQNVESFLKQYFDPNDGNLTQRLDKLVRHDGEIATLLGQHLGKDDSTIARTLAQHVGTESPLFKLLSPEQSDGLVAKLNEIVEGKLREQRDHVLKQFSLDDPESALSRLLKQVSDKNGNLRQELAEDMEKVRKEFSLDDENSALSRLVKQVDEAKKQMTKELSLDEENSALSRIRKELATFQAEVRTTLEALQVRKEEQSRSPQHGVAFEDAVAQLLGREAQRLGDIFERTGATTGVLPRSKKGDFVVEMGPESAAPGGKVVVEAKDKPMSLPEALKELDEAKRNREAQLGVFVYGTGAAPQDMEPLLRYGNDLVVTWDVDDPASDVYLKAALSVARALIVREEARGAESTADLAALDNAIASVVKALGGAEKIRGWAKTIGDRARDISDEAYKLERKAKGELERMQDVVEDLRRELAGGGAES